jgi:hypothetical protein
MSLPMMIAFSNAIHNIHHSCRYPHVAFMAECCVLEHDRSEAHQ